MSFSDRLSNGWAITLNSFKVLKENKQLILFPILSGISLLLIIASFSTAVLANAGWNFDAVDHVSKIGGYALLIGFYIVNYFIVVFFNTALVHCVSLYFKGEKVAVKEGISFSISRIGVIFSWAIFAGTVGAALKIIQENVGKLGQIITAIIGIVWGVATFFVVPIIASENLGPIDALKRSTQLMKEKWGQSIGAAFSFALIQIGFLAAVVISAFLIGNYINLYLGVAIGILGIAAIFIIFSAVRTIFITAIYLNVTGDPVENYDQHFIDNLFIEKKKAGFLKK